MEFTRVGVLMSDVARRENDACWHPRLWRFKRETLELSTHAGGYEYAIDLEECDSCAEILDWIAQIAKKAWATPELVAELVYAFDALFDLQAHVCSFGRPRRFKPRTLLKNSRHGT